MPTTRNLLASAISGYVCNGDFGDFVQAISSIRPCNVGSAAQFAENSFYNNKGFSNYHGLLLTLQKNMSHGLHYDFNYTCRTPSTTSPSSPIRRAIRASAASALVCDAVRPRECRASSDFDVKQYISADAAYDLPFGKGKMFAGQPHWGVTKSSAAGASAASPSWHTGYPWRAHSNAFVASYSNDAPAILTGQKKYTATHLTKLPGGGVNVFADNLKAGAQYSGPIGFKVGERNGLRGPNFFNADMGLGKTFPITAERVNLKFRADAFNVLNHPNFALPASNGFNGYDQWDAIDGVRASRPGKGFGQSSFTVSPVGNMNSGARVLELSLRLEF